MITLIVLIINSVLLKKKQVISTLTFLVIVFAGYFLLPVAYYYCKEEKKTYEIREKLAGKWLLFEKGKAYEKGTDSISFGLYHRFIKGELPSLYKIEKFPTSYANGGSDIYFVFKRRPFKIVKLTKDTLIISQALPIGNPIGPIEVYIKSNPDTLH